MTSTLSQNLKTTIQSLPLEVLDIILDRAGKHRWDPSSISRSRNLSRLSLVCKLWHDVAQRRLHANVYLWSISEMEKLVRTTLFGTYPTKELSLQNGYGIASERDELDQILRRVRGVRSLFIGGLDVALALLGFSGLSALEHLELRDVTFNQNDRDNLVEMPESLKSLIMEGYYYTDSSTPYSRFYSPSLTTLSVRDLDWRTIDCRENHRLKLIDLSHLIELASPHLLVLHLPFDLSPCLIGAIASCTKLLSLETSCKPQEFVKLIRAFGSPAELRTIILEGGRYPPSAQDWVDALTQVVDYDVITNLEKLALNHWCREEVMDRIGGEKLIEKMEKAGVKCTHIWDASQIGYA